jgi:predicted PurR-regulated permease PerM
MLTGPESERLLLPRSASQPGDRDAANRSSRTGASSSGPTFNPSWSDVPWRTIIAVVGVLLTTYILLVLVLATVRIIAWVAVAGFFAIVLAPLVRRVQARIGDRRTVATGIVVFTTLGTIAGVITLFILPVRKQLVDILTDLPGTVHDAAAGKGPIGNLVKKLHIESYVQHNEDKLAKAAARLNGSTFDTATTVLSATLAFVTITLITFLFLSQAEAMGRAATSLIPQRRRASVRRIAVEAAAAVSGYVIGNLLISLIAGAAAFACLVILGVPSPIVLALFVAFADLIPLVGATLGAAVSVLAAYLYSPTAGLVSLIFFIVYQQVENGLIYPWIMARKVNVNPLVVILSVLVGVELFGILGALLAVPASGALQVIIKAARQEHQREQLVLPENMSQSLDVSAK